MELFDFQLDLCRRVWRQLFVNNEQRVMLQSPTGSGKTVMLAFLLKQMEAMMGMESLVFAHRREIVNQTHERLRAFKLNPGVIMAGDIPTPYRTSQVASIDSYAAWTRRNMPDQTPGIVVIDEAHRSMGKRYRDVIERLVARGAKLLGATATPMRNDGQGLADMYDVMECAPSMRELQRLGRLCPANYKVGLIPTLDGVKLTAKGDYSPSHLEEAVNQKLLIGDIVENWFIHSMGRATMVFAAGIQHSRNIVHEFREHGVPAVHIDGTTPLSVRDRVLEDLRIGRIKVVSNAQVYVEGTDVPYVSCVIFAQPTKSLIKYLQQGGRGMRVFPGKENCNFHDHAGVVNHFGRIEMDRPWRLVHGDEMVEEMRKTRDKEKVEWDCPQCGERFRGAKCPVCSKVVEFTGRAKRFVPAELVDLTQAEFELLQTEHKHKFDVIIERKDFYLRARTVAARWGKKEGWTRAVYEMRYKEPPRDEWLRERPRPETPEVKSYCQSALIRYAKGEGRERAS